MKRRHIIYITVTLMLGIIMLTGCNKKNKNQETDTDKVTVVPTVSPTIAPTMPPENDDPNNDTDPNEEAPDEAPDDVPDEFIVESDAVKLIQNVIGERGYYIELINDNIVIEDQNYYLFQICDATNKYDPDVIVNKVSGEILCYYEDGSTADFSEHGLNALPSGDDNTEDTDSEDSFTKEDALLLLGKVSAETLGLPVALSEYTIMFDDWTTNIKGVECYGINAFADTPDRMINMGVFYVALDGSVMFKFDVMMDDFVEIKE